MNEGKNSKSVPALPNDNEILDSEINLSDDFTKICQGVAYCMMNDSDSIENAKIRAKDLAEENVQKEIDEPTPQIISKDKIVIANQKKEDGWKLLSKNDYEDVIDAIKLFSEAIELYSEAIELNPYDYSLYYSRGECYRALKQYEKAIQDYSKAIEINLNDMWLYDSRGICYQALEKYEEAIQDYSKAIELEPNGAWLYIWRAKCYYAIGNNKKAWEDRKKARELGW